MPHFNSWLDAMEELDHALDMQGDIYVAGTPLKPSEALRELRPMEYRTALYEWLDAQNIDEDESDKWDDLDMVP